MMWDSSIFFKRVGKNQYLFRNRGVASKYGYLLTYKEKNAMENLINFISIKIMAGVLPILIYAQVKKSIIAYISCFIYVIFGSIYLHYRFKKIIGNRVRVYCGRLSLFKLCETQSKLMTSFEIVKYFFLMVLGNVILIFAVKLCIDENRTELLVISLFLFIAGIFGFLVSIICLIYKLMQNFKIET